MAETLTVIGNYLSPYVRKVLVCLELKGIPYRIDPIAPFVGDEEFSRLSPLRRIPVLLENGTIAKDLGVPMLSPLEDRIMICGSPEMLRDLKALAEKLDFEEGSTSRPGDFVIERAFVSS